MCLVVLSKLMCIGFLPTSKVASIVAGDEWFLSDLDGSLLLELEEEIFAIL